MPTRLIDTVYGDHRHDTPHTGRHYRADKPTASSKTPVVATPAAVVEPEPKPKKKNGKRKNGEPS